MTNGERTVRILLADDAADSRLLLQAFLKQLPCQVEVAQDGAAAVEQFIRGSYDLVLLDMQMPVMDGCAAARSIRAWEAEHGRKPAPILALSAYASQDDAERSLEAGCTACLTKPIRKAALLEAIREQLQAQTAPGQSEVREDDKLVLRIDPQIAKLVPHFLANRQTDIEAIQESLAHGDFAAVEVLAHRMKGSGGAYGLDAITEIGGALETAAQARDAGAIRVQVGALSSYLARLELDVAR